METKKTVSVVISQRLDLGPHVHTFLILDVD